MANLNNKTAAKSYFSASTMIFMTIFTASALAGFAMIVVAISFMR
jgi:hypothetical protein